MASGSEGEIQEKINRITAYTTYILEDVLRLETSTKKIGNRRFGTQHRG